MSQGPSPSAARRLLCVGYGYSARALAARLSARPRWTVIGTTRSEHKPRDPADGTPLLRFDRTVSQDLGDALAEATHLLISTPPDDGGDPLIQALEGSVAASAPGLQWVGYLSTTGVYGDRAGGWVFEDDPLDPASKRGARRVLAEDQWARQGVPHHLFRLPGIYGPGRSALDRVREGTARRIVKPGQVFSRIHVDDLAAGLEASIDRPHPGGAYNLCDDEPSPPQDVIAFAAELLGLEPPPEIAFDDADLSPMARSFYGESKRVSNARMKGELGVRPAYPTYREGLRAILDTGF